MTLPLTKRCPVINTWRNFNVSNQVTETRNQRQKSTLTTIGYPGNPHPGPFNVQTPNPLFSQGPPPADLVIRPPHWLTSRTFQCMHIEHWHKGQRNTMQHIIHKLFKCPRVATLLTISLHSFIHSFIRSYICQYPCAIIPPLKKRRQRAAEPSLN